LPALSSIFAGFKIRSVFILISPGTGETEQRRLKRRGAGRGDGDFKRM
jgi:hypothetical protein